MRVLLVDGYNLIYSHPRLSSLVERDPESAREELLGELAPLASPSNYQAVTVVFDAAGSRNPEPVLEERAGMSVIFTRRGQSADAFIEGAARRMASDVDMEVATSDRILGSLAARFGALILSGDALFSRAREALAETREEIGRLAGEGRNPLEDRLGEEARRLLDRMRYQ